uniref:HDIG n=1 Tax=Chlorobium chlorochromatii (strain CaD3) TaxID=340177 RepID=Q3ASN2_CHLCH
MKALPAITPFAIPDILCRIGDIADREDAACYLVGGYVRDLMMKRPCTDVDIMITGDPVPFAHMVQEELQGRNFVLFERFRTAQLELDDPNLGTFKVELVGARKESYNSDSRKPITLVGTLEDDLMRRDFTINALAMRLNREERYTVTDLFNGMEDMEAKILRTPLEPLQTFSDDPLRMMRAARFAAQLDFTLLPNALEAIRAMHERIHIVSMERVSHEFLKIMRTHRPSVGLLILHETGLLKELLPEVSAMAGIEQVDGMGHKDTLFHTMQVVDTVATYSDNLWLRIAALLHDVAKPVTKRFSKQSGWTFHGHDAVGIKMVAKIFRTMRWSHEHLEYVQKLVRLHHRPIPLSKEEITDSAVRRLMFDAGEDLRDLMTLCRSDVTSKNPRKVARIMSNFNHVEAKIAEVGEKDQLAKWRPPISGQDIMEALGLAEGKAVGKIKKQMENAVIDGIIAYDREAALAYVRKVYEEMKGET